MIQKPNNIIISDSRRPIWHLLIAAACYTCVVVLLYTFFANFRFGESLSKMKSISGMLQSAIVLTGVAVRFSMQTNIVFDIDNNRYKKQYAISRITFGRWKDFRSLDYISVFKYKAYEYQVSLWYDRNQHWKIVSYEDKKAAINQGMLLADKFGIGVLDSTVANNGKWIA